MMRRSSLRADRSELRDATLSLQASAKPREALGCPHCLGAGPEPGWIEQDNNGPIVACPICNPQELRAKPRERAARDTKC